jgi:hypothetical protein
MQTTFLYSTQLGIVKRLASILVLLLVLSGVTFANDTDMIPFAVGEKLTYQIFWGPFVVGRATLEVAGLDPVDGHSCYHLVAKAKTSGLANLMFPVDSTAESWLDCDGLFAREYREDRTEGKHHRSGETHYDYARNETIITNHINGKQKHLSLDQHVQDVVSSLYVVRTRKLMLGSEQTFMINAGTTNYNVTVRPDVRRSIWVRPVGDIQALRIEPTPTLSIVSANKGRMWFWLSDDARRLPLLVNSEIKFGSARLILFSIAAGKASSGMASRSTDAARSLPTSSIDQSLASGR